MTDERTVLLLGNYRPTVTLTRRLADYGYRVIVTSGRGGLAASSRSVAEVWDPPVGTDDPEFVDILAAFLNERPDIGYIVPVEESAVLEIAHHRDKLPEDRVYGTPADETVITCLDKVAMLEVAKRAKVPSAPAKIVETIEEVRAAADRIGFPLVVRPLSSSLPIAGRKAFIAMSRDVIEDGLTEWPEGHEQLIVQRFIRGPRFNVDFAAQKGRLIRAVATRILRTDAYDGTGIDVSGKTLPMPSDLREYTQRMVAELDYHGVGLIQFMVDRERDEISFVELNPRFNGNTAVPEHAGLELSRLAIDLVVDPDRDEKPFEAPGGLRHAWFFGDVRGVWTSLQHGLMTPWQVPGALWRALRDASTADFHIMVERGDPMPGVTQFTNPLVHLFRRRPG
jgi:predicted ATP-grasp superfamily ATP-dependent carboligase